MGRGKRAGSQTMKESRGLGRVNIAKTHTAHLSLERRTGHKDTKT